MECSYEKKRYAQISITASTVESRNKIQKPWKNTPAKDVSPNKTKIIFFYKYYCTTQSPGTKTLKCLLINKKKKKKKKIEQDRK